MTEAPGPALATLDPKLNVFALANGMDLRPEGDARVLEWYRDGLDRRIRLEPDVGAARFAVRAVGALATRGRRAEAVVTVESALRVEEIAARFPELLAGAVDAANAMTREDLSELP